MKRICLEYDYIGGNEKVYENSNSLDYLFMDRYKSDNLITRIDKYFMVNETMASTEMYINDFIILGKSMKELIKKINGNLELAVDEENCIGSITIRTRKLELVGTLCVKLGSILMDLENINIYYDDLKKMIYLIIQIHLLDNI